MSLARRYDAAVAGGALKPDPAQRAAVEKLSALADALGDYRRGGFPFFRKAEPPQGLYLWGDVGRGKSMLMDLFFENAPIEPRRRVHFNAFMADVQERLHGARARPETDDPLAAVARAVAAEARLLCFDEFQVEDVADAMILGRLFEQLFAAGTVIVTTSNTPPDRLYEGGLNRQLFLPFIAQIQTRLAVVALNGPIDYRLQRIAGLDLYLTPLGPKADAAMDRAWARLTDGAEGHRVLLHVLGRNLAVPRAARGVARFDFSDLCECPLAAPDYLEIARHFHTLLLDRIPLLGPQKADAARRFVVLIDTLYDAGVKLVCSAAAASDALYRGGRGAAAFRRAASRLAEMASRDYLKRGHGARGRHAG